jgi:hypothetical protein
MTCGTEAVGSTPVYRVANRWDLSASVASSGWVMVTSLELEVFLAEDSPAEAPGR